MNSILKLFLAIIVLLVVQSCKKDEEISYQLKKPDKIEKQASAILDKNSPLVKHVKVLYASENVIFTWDLAHYRSIADLREDDTPTDERDYAESYYYYYGRVIDDSGLIHNNMTIRYYTQTYKVFVEEFKPLAKEYIAAAEFIIKNNITREQVEKIYEGLRNEIEEIRVNGGCTYDFVSNLSRYFPANAYDYEFESDVLRRVNQKLLQSIYSMDYSYDSLTGKFYATSWSKSTCGGQLSTWKSTLDNYILEAGNSLNDNSVIGSVSPEPSMVDYEEDLWWNGSVTFTETITPQTLPSWSMVRANYLDGWTVPQIYNLVGGMPKSIYLEKMERNGNTCAIRISRALSYSGVTIPYLKNNTFKGDDNKYYFMSMAKLLNWMKRTFGPATIHLTQSDGGTNGMNFINHLSGVKGIYLMKASYPGENYFEAQGHATLFDGFSCVDGNCYFDAKGGVETIDLWQLF